MEMYTAQSVRPENRAQLKLCAEKRNDGTMMETMITGGTDVGVVVAVASRIVWPYCECLFSYKAGDILSALLCSPPAQ